MLHCHESASLPLFLGCSQHLSLYSTIRSGVAEGASADAALLICVEPRQHCTSVEYHGLWNSELELRASSSGGGQESVQEAALFGGGDGAHAAEVAGSAVGYRVQVTAHACLKVPRLAIEFINGHLGRRSTLIGRRGVRL